METYLLMPIALLLGTIAGTLTGLFPGIHINLISAILVSSLSLPFISSLPIISLIVFIVSMSITHTFLDFIPSILLGAPEEDSFLSVLPGHQLLKQGRGYEAIILTLYGSISALLFLPILIPAFIFFLPTVFSSIKLIIPFILVFISVFLICREKDILLSLLVFVLSGLLVFL